MGEYANTSNGERVKIGTCENMYYLRLSQAASVSPEYGNVDPVKDVESLWFRLPFRGEEHVPPGSFKEHDRHFPVDLKDIEDGHELVQLSSRGSGLMANVKCTAATRYPAKANIHDGSEPVRFFRNGGAGGYKLKMLGIRNGEPALLVGCLDCMGAWSIRGEGEVNDVLEKIDSEFREFAELIRAEFQSFLKLKVAKRQRPTP